MSRRPARRRLRLRIPGRPLLTIALAVVLVIVLGSVRPEVRALIEEVLDAAAGPSTAQAAQEGEWLEAGPAEIAPQELASLEIAAQDRSADDYDRVGEFGRAWIDVDGNGCDTRNDILARDLVDITYEDGGTCTVASGTLHDPYTGTTLDGDLSREVHIDHIVSLGDAWYSGADGWTQERREQFANDPDNLVAVDASANISKSDDSIAPWYERWDAPSELARCRYAAQYVHVLAGYELSVTRDDYLVLKTMQGDCAGG